MIALSPSARSLHNRAHFYKADELVLPHLKNEYPQARRNNFDVVKPDDNNRQQTILLVEDTDEVIIVMRDYLEYAGYKVEIATTGIGGIAQAKKVRPDLILMDVQMPDLDGLAATEQLRSDVQFQQTPIIAVTALAMKGDRERCLAAGMNEYITKPVNLKAMLKLIEGLLADKGKSIV